MTSYSPLRAPPDPGWSARDREAWDRLLAPVREDLEKLDADVSAAQRLEEAKAALVAATKIALSRLQQVTPSRNHVMALCPFHNDRHIGSFFVSPTTGSFQCWSCHARGGIRKLLAQLGVSDTGILEALKGVDYRVLMEAIEGTSSRANLAIDAVKPLPESLLRPWARMRPQRMLDRGHSPSLLDVMELGVDEKRMRMTVPIRRVGGDLVAVQARVLNADDTGPRWKFYRGEFKYDLPPEVFAEYGLADYEPPRHIVLYNEHNILTSLAAGLLTQPVSISEGVGHVLRVMETLTPALGTFGTVLTQHQLARLRAAWARAERITRQRQTVLLTQDGDRPGRFAAFRMAVALEPRVQALITPIPEGKDPEDLTPRDLRARLLSARSLHTILTESSREGEWAREFMAEEGAKALDQMEREARRRNWLQRQEQSRREQATHLLAAQGSSMPIGIDKLGLPVKRQT